MNTTDRYEASVNVPEEDTFITEFLGEAATWEWTITDNGQLILTSENDIYAFARGYWREFNVKKIQDDE